MTAIYGDLAACGERNAQVTRDVLAALQRGRNCLVLTNWTGHLETLTGLLRDAGHDPVVLRGGMGAKSQAAAIARLEHDRPLLLVATGPYAGEGSDCPALDTLFLTAPVSYKGRLVQYADRILRTSRMTSRTRRWCACAVLAQPTGRKADNRLSWSVITVTNGDARARR
jgi:superfamily II DNA or RNA helicase